jgi:tRNA dimethylallyltransferase
MMAVTNPILAIVGPTASGKSSLALEIARRRSAEILSIDSMQIYKGMNIGTAKPSAIEQSLVVHHLIDVAAANESFSAARFVELADAAIASAQSRNRPLVATGGTPMYFKALFDGLFEGPGADEAIRERLNQLPTEELHQRLRQVDPEAAGRIHMADRKRLVRALEVFEQTGVAISSLQTQWAARKPRHHTVWVGLLWEKSALNRRINARVQQMIAAGWVDEVRHLLAQPAGLSPTATQATGYRELIDHIQGRMSLEDAIEQIKIATRQLARRQMKWLRRFANVTWLEGDGPMETLVERTLAAWDAERVVG